MLTVENIHKLIEQNKCPAWKLQYLNENGRWTSISTYDEPLYLKDNDMGIDERIKNSIEYLNSQLEHYKQIPSAKFQIFIRKGKTVAHENALGGFAFMQSANGFNSPYGQQSGFGGLSGMDGNNFLNQMLSLKDKEIDIKIKQIIHERDLTDLAEKKEKFESKSEQLGDAFLRVVDKVTEVYFPKIHKDGGLGATTKTESEKKTEEETIIEDMATDLFNSELSKAELEKLKQVVADIVTKIKKQKAEKSE